MDVVIARFGVPLQLLSVNGKEFDNSIMKKLCRLLEKDKLRTTVYKASTNGAVRTPSPDHEFHVRKGHRHEPKRTIGTNSCLALWRHIEPAVMRPLAFTPNFLVFGRENAAPFDVVFLSISRIRSDSHYMRRTTTTLSTSWKS